MMGDHRFGPTKSRQLHGLDPSPNIDLLVNSESPQIQEIRLYRELNREIEKNSGDRLRYVDSELYSKVREQSPVASGSSEVQSTTVNVGLSPQSRRKNSKISNNGHRNSDASQLLSKRDEEDAMDYSNNATSDRERFVLDGNCQVCLIKGLRDDLTNITKVIQERNEQLTSKLKAKRMRSFFERQMLD